MRSTPTSGSTNRLTGAVLYDGAGSLTSWNGNTYEYGPFGEMSAYRSGTESWLYLYTVDEERVRAYDLARSIGYFSIRDLDGRLLREYRSNSWTTPKDYIYRSDGRLVSSIEGTTLRHLHVDHLGSVRQITNSSGSSVEYHVFYPFGEEATATGTEQMKFTGHERDLANPAGTADDLDYMHARFANPQLGRFLSTDPINTATPIIPQSWNKYTYARNNPARLVDRNGLWEEDFHLDLTFVAAVIAGTSDELARSIAAATQAVDTARATQPITLDLSVREGYHFPSDARLSELLAAASKDPMKDLGDGRTPLGDYLHALQDSFSHQFGNQRFKNSHYPGPSGSFDPRAGFTLLGPDFDNTAIRPMVAFAAFVATVATISQTMATTPVLGTGEYQSLLFDALKASGDSAERQKLVRDIYVLAKK